MGNHDFQDMPIIEGIRPQRPRDEVGEAKLRGHFHWPRLNCPWSRQNLSNSKREPRCNMPPARRLDLQALLPALRAYHLSMYLSHFFYHSLPCWSLQGCNYKVVRLYLKEYLNPWGIGARPGGKNTLGHRTKRFLSGSPCLKSVGHKSPTVFGAILTGTEWELLARLPSFKQIFFDFILDIVASKQMFLLCSKNCPKPCPNTSVLVQIAQKPDSKNLG